MTILVWCVVLVWARFYAHPLGLVAYERCFPRPGHFRPVQPTCEALGVADAQGGDTAYRDSRMSASARRNRNHPGGLTENGPSPAGGGGERPAVECCGADSTRAAARLARQTSIGRTDDAPQNGSRHRRVHARVGAHTRRRLLDSGTADRTPDDREALRSADHGVPVGGYVRRGGSGPDSAVCNRFRRAAVRRGSGSLLRRPPRPRTDVRSRRPVGRERVDPHRVDPVRVRADPSIRTSTVTPSREKGSLEKSLR